MRQQLLNAIYAGQPFRQVLRDLGLTANQVWGLTKTDEEWSEQLEALDGQSSGRPRAWHHCGVRAWLRMQQVSRAPATADG
ncbi:MAG TPA: hypothetical protein VI094_22130 [Propionibacteriaceae bacterium]